MERFIDFLVGDMKCKLLFCWVIIACFLLLSVKLCFAAEGFFAFLYILYFQVIFVTIALLWSMPKKMFKLTLGTIDGWAPARVQIESSSHLTFSLYSQKKKKKKSPAWCSCLRKCSSWLMVDHQKEYKLNLLAI